MTREVDSIIARGNAAKNTRRDKLQRQWQAAYPAVSTTISGRKSRCGPPTRPTALIWPDADERGARPSPWSGRRAQ
jgi:hypothetical protein